MERREGCVVGVEEGIGVLREEEVRVVEEVGAAGENVEKMGGWEEELEGELRGVEESVNSLLDRVVDAEVALALVRC